MAFRVPPLRVPRMRGRSGWLAAVAVAIVVLFVLFGVYDSLYTDLLWFRSVGFSTVFSRRLVTQLVLFFVFAIAMVIVVGANIVVAYRTRPPFRPMSPEQQQLETLRTALHPYRAWVLSVVLLLVGILTGTAAAGRWRTWMLWRNGQDFGIKDPQFHRDVSYYAFTYPMQRFVLGMLFAAVVVSLIAVLATAYLTGGLRPQTAGPKVTPAARAHISVLLGFFVLLKGWAYWLDRYGLNFSKRGFVDTGASYTDVHAVIPAKTILVVVAVICAGIFFANVRIRNWRLPAIAFGVMVLSAVVIGGIYPLLVQQFSVRPSEADKEATYISRNITQTRAAYGLELGKQVVPTPYSGTATGDPKALRADKATLPNIRLLDPTIVTAAFKQLQGFKSYYSFPSTLDVDRYDVSGNQEEQVVAVRDVDVTQLPAAQQSWINQHLVYTHGFGFVSAASNTVASDGTPTFDVSDIPPHGSLVSSFEPRVYFGESSPQFSIVGGSAKGQQRELDYPNNSGTGQQNNTYAGKGGVEIGSAWRKLLYAWHFTDKNFLFSSGVNSKSRLLYIRDPKQRVAKVAPFLTLDSDPYPAIANGRIVWIVDGYTTSDGFPYAARTSLSSATTDTVAQSRLGARTPVGQVNYIRNSVKAIVDAYDGTVNLYQWGQRDPVLETWKHAFPGIIKPQSEIPPSVLPHLRYPEDLFKVQRTLLTRYHITDPRAFYSGQDYWKVPDDPTQSGITAQPPYYLTFAMPGQTTPTFQLTTTLLQNNGRNLAAFVSVQSDPSASDYGTMRVLQLPTNALVPGPGLVHNDLRAFPQASTEISLLDQRGSKVEEGNLLTLPIGGSFVYVEPLFVRSTAATSFPTLKRVLVSYNGTIAYQPTLKQALDVVFGSAPNVSPPPSSSGGQPPPPASSSVASLVASLVAAQNDAEAALRRGDLAAYAAAEKRVSSLIAELSTATKSSGASSSSSSSSPSPSPSG